jgi:hypothetical protein
LQQNHADVQPYSLENLRNGSEVLINAQLQVDGLEAECGVLTGVIALFPISGSGSGNQNRHGRQRFCLYEWGCLQGAPLVEWWNC